MKLCILVGYKFLIKKFKFWGQSVHFRSCDITKHGIYKIGHISAIFKDRNFWFRPKNSIKLCAEHFTTLGVIKYISGHVTGPKLFFGYKIANIFEMVPGKHVLTIIHR